MLSWAKIGQLWSLTHFNLHILAENLKNGIGFGSTEFHVVRPQGILLRKWIFYYLIQEGFRREAKRHMTGSAGQKRVPTRYIKKVLIPVAPLPEQRRIVEKIEELLSDLDAGVAALQKAQQQLARYHQSVLKAAVEGRLTASWRAKHGDDTESASILLDRILQERRIVWEADYKAKYEAKGKTPPKGWQSRYKEPEPPDTSDLPELPEGWVWTTAEQLSVLDIGYAFKSKQFVDDGMPLLRGANIEPGALRWEDKQCWPYDEVTPFKHLIVEENDIILAMDRPLISSGLKIARASASDTPCLLVQRVARFKPVDEKLADYLYVAMRTQKFIMHLLGGQTGTQLPHISGSGILSYVMPLPPIEEQLAIVEAVERLLSITDEGERTVTHELHRAERLRQSILKKAFEGKLVPQDPSDESASLLLEHIKKGQKRSTRHTPYSSPQLELDV